MRLSVQFDRPGFADGLYTLEARGFVLGVLRWAGEKDVCPDWMSLGFITLDALGNGSFRLEGGRSVPPGITRVAADLISADFDRRERVYFTLPADQLAQPMKQGTRFVLMSDLHLSRRTDRIRWALRRTRDADCVLLAGDLTNDGLPEQFELFQHCIEEEIPDVPVLAVTGNHDYPRMPVPLIETGIQSYPRFQSWLLERARSMGVSCEESESGAYAAVMGDVRILGLNAVTHWRRFAFPEGRQLDWLEAELRSGEYSRNILLCHAPLAAHNPMQGGDGDVPYLARNRRLQDIVDAAPGCVFVSGHTHLSMNEACGCVETDGDNVYINDSSIVTTMLRETPSPADREWLDSALLRLNISGRSMELQTEGLRSRKFIARGYYRWEE